MFVSPAVIYDTLSRNNPIFLSRYDIQMDVLSARINKLPKWARDYIHHVSTFVGAPEVQELVQLRDERRALIKLIAELKVENRRLKKKVGM